MIGPRYALVVCAERSAGYNASVMSSFFMFQPHHPRSASICAIFSAIASGSASEMFEITDTTIPVAERHDQVEPSATRFARDKHDHVALRSQSLGISLRSTTEPIHDTSTGKLMEGVLAAFAQFDNDCRSDWTRAGMKAALEPDFR
jgi:hypothetical protein